jgi:hypothetical protein
MKKSVIFCNMITESEALFVIAVEEQHHVMNLSDLKCGEMPPGLPSGLKWRC